MNVIDLKSAVSVWYCFTITVIRIVIVSLFSIPVPKKYLTEIYFAPGQTLAQLKSCGILITEGLSYCETS